MDFFLTSANALQYGLCQVGVFDRVDVVFYHLFDVEAFRAPGFLCQSVKAFFNV